MAGAASIELQPPPSFRTVNSGPMECERADRVVSGKDVTVHYVLSIAESSENGEKGARIASSLEPGGELFTFQVGGGKARTLSEPANAPTFAARLKRPDLTPPTPALCAAR
jgi:hypothetical protein